MSIQAEDSSEAREGSRIAKVMARAGLCSRRDAEQWIAEGRVSVNGAVLTSPAYNVSEADDVRVDGEPLRAAERTRLFLFHKPRGFVTTAKDPEGRPTIFDALPKDLPRVVSVGRLDINSEGLLLLTNDGGLSRVLELPATGWLRRYRVRAHGEITQEQLDGLREGVTIDGVDYLGIEARFERQQGANVWLTMGLREGKNREIKRVLEHMGLSVNRLIRVSFGPFELADLPEREVFEVRTRVLRDQLGPKLAQRAGANFNDPAETAPVVEPPPPRGDRPMRRPRGDSPTAPPPRSDDGARKRKHVSVLRTEAGEQAAGPRKRIARSATADRKGREVKVEHVMLARPPETAPRREGGFRASRSEERPARPFRSDARPARAPRAEGDARPERNSRTPREGGFRASRSEERPARPFRSDARPARAPRPEGDARPERSPRAPREDGFRASRSEARPARPFRSDARPARAPRPEGDARPERSPRTPREGGFRASRSEERPARAFRSDARPARAPRPEGDARPERNPRAPRPEGGFRASRSEERPARAFRSDARPARAPRAEGDARPERSPRTPRGKSGGRPPSKSGDRPPSKSGGRPPSKSGPPRGPRKPRGG